MSAMEMHVCEFCHGKIDQSTEFDDECFEDLRGNSLWSEDDAWSAKKSEFLRKVVNAMNLLGLDANDKAIDTVWGRLPI